MKLDIYNNNGSKISRKADLDKKVFGVMPNEHCVYLTIKAELSAKRQGNSSSKTKGEVRGGGAKPWRQKGTGRARIGSLRNSSRVHGGVAFGPKPHSYSFKINKKVKKLAKKSILSEKLSSGHIMVIENFKLKNISTREIDIMLKRFKILDKKINILIDEDNKNLYLSCRNLQDVRVSRIREISTYDLLYSDILLIDEKALQFFNEMS